MQTTPRPHLPISSLIDIDTIEIRSEDDEQDAVTAIKPRRTYNYRVCVLDGVWVRVMWLRCGSVVG